MALNLKAYDHIKWVNIFDESVDENWLKNYLGEYRETFPNHRPEIEPVAKDGEELNTYWLRSLTAGQLNRVDRLEGLEKFREICAYGIANWSGINDKHGVSIKPTFTKDGLGDRLTSESLDLLNFFGYNGLPLIIIVATQILTISRFTK